LPEAARNALGSDFSRALSEYRATLAHSADRPESRLAEGWLALQQGDTARAQSAYQSALRIEPRYLPASINLADLYRATGRNAEGVALLRQALERVPDSADLHHTLGLALIRDGQAPEALEHFARAASAAPENARFAYVYAIALQDAGQTPRAIALLEQAITRHPGDRELRMALVDFAARSGRRDLVEKQLRELFSLWPNDPDVSALRAALEGGGGGLNTQP
jgi:Flp pilus assembly protein TadD